MKKNNKFFLVVLILSFCVPFFASFITLSDVGITWDEPVYLNCAKQHASGIKSIFLNLVRGKIETAFSKEITKKYWYCNVEHPQFSKIMMACSYLMFGKFFGEIKSVRLLSVIMYSATVFILFLMMYKLYNITTAIISILFLISLPRYFGHSNIISLDIQTGFLTLLCVYTFILGLENKKWSIVYGIVQGLSISVRVNLFFLPFIFFLWAFIFYRHKIKYNLLFLILLAPVVYFITNPYLWHNTFYHIDKYINNLFTREDYNRIPLYYLGKQYVWTYPYKKPIYYPWHYPYIIILVTTPGVILINFFIGLAKVFLDAKYDRIKILFFLNFLFFLLLFTPTNIPKYDGERLFLPSFIFLCAIAGVGAVSIFDLINKFLKKQKKIFLFFIVAIILIILFLPFYVVKPFYLEYYNEFVGGIKGAKKMGFETTYWGNVVDGKFLEHLNKNIPKNSKILFSPYATEIIEFYKKEGKLRKDLKIDCATLVSFRDINDYDYFVLIARQGCFTKASWTFYKYIRYEYAIFYSDVPMVMLYRLR